MVNKRKIKSADKQSTCSSNDNSYNEYQSNSTDQMSIAVRVSLRRRNVVSIENEEQCSKKASLR